MCHINLKDKGIEKGINRIKLEEGWLSELKGGKVIEKSFTDKGISKLEKSLDTDGVIKYISDLRGSIRLNELSSEEEITSVLKNIGIEEISIDDIELRINYEDKDLIKYQGVYKTESVIDEVIEKSIEESIQKCIKDAVSKGLYNISYKESLKSTNNKIYLGESQYKRG